MPPAELDIDAPDTATDAPTNLIWIDPVFPPGVSDDIKYLAGMQARQHFERRLDARTTTGAINAGAKHTNKRLDKIDTDVLSLREEVRAKPGKGEVRFIIGVSVMMLVVLLVAVLQLRGINTGQVVRDTRDLINVAGQAADKGANPAPQTAP